MATFLQIGLLNYFSIIFPALLIFFVVFAILQKTKVLGENITVNAIVGIAIAFIVILFRDIVTVINFMIPWFVIIFIFLILLLVVLKIMGATDATIAEMLANNKSVQWILVGIGVIILIAAIAHVYGERLVPVTAEGEIAEGAEIGEGESAYKQSIMKVIFNPLILGMLFILILAIAAIGLLTRERF